MLTQRNLRLFLRHVHVSADENSRDPNKIRPRWFSHERCFVNLMETISNDRLADKVTITVMYDGNEEQIKTDFISRYLGKANANLVFINAGSDMASFTNTVRYASLMTYSDEDIYYFIENDYMHVDGWVTKSFEAFEDIQNFDYLSLYDHKDKYTSPLYRQLQSQIKLSRSHHWRTAPSTCASFMARKSRIIADQEVLLAGLGDYYMFTELCQHRDRGLITPIPGLATHCMEGYLSPNVDWEMLAFEKTSI